MVWPFKKRNDVLDLTVNRNMKLPQKKESSVVKASSEDSIGSFFGAISGSSVSPADLDSKSLKIKLEDIEYKLNSFLRKVSDIFDRIDVAEKRLDRLDRKNRYGVEEE